MTEKQQAEFFVSVHAALREEQMMISVEVGPEVFEWATFTNRPGRRTEPLAPGTLEVMLADGRWAIVHECDVDITEEEIEIESAESSAEPEPANTEPEPANTEPEPAGRYVDCGLFAAGHQIHYTYVLRDYAKKRRINAQVRHVEGQQFVVTVGDQESIRYFHDPALLKAAIKEQPNNFKSVMGTTCIIIANPEGGASWFNLSETPPIPCKTVAEVEAYFWLD